jgi:hypothetical protein
MEILLDELFQLHPQDSKTNVCVAVPVPRDFESLEFICSYEPKPLDNEDEARQLLEAGLDRYVPPEYREQYRGTWRKYFPVVSLITLSVDYNGAYIGCAHRHAPEQRHIISAKFASPGFFKHPAAAGNWRAVINVHAVVSSEVRYRLQVYGHDSI